MKSFLCVALLSLVFVACSTKTAQKMAEPMNERASIQYDFAFEAYQRGDLIPALTFALKAREESPRSPQVLNLLGLIHFRASRPLEAEEALRLALELDPHATETYTNLGSLLYDQKRYAEAQVVLERGLENPLYIYPERLHNNLGLALEAQGKLKEAEASFQQAVEIRKDFFLAYQNLGKLKKKQGDLSAAKLYFEETIRYCQVCSEPRYWLGQILLTQNKKSEAQKEFLKAVELDPEGYFGQLSKVSLNESDRDRRNAIRN